MSIFSGNKTELLEKILELEKQNAVKDQLLENKVEEVAHLRKQVDKLQDSLLAVQHPDAYRELKNDEILLQEPPEPTEEEMEYRNRKGEEAKILKEYLDSSEGPLFKDADEMMDSLVRIVGVPEPGSIHDNDES
jgi:uncharacterized coiled-coil protein SlyX